MTAFFKKCTIIFLITNGFINVTKAQKLTSKQETAIRQTIHNQYGEVDKTIKLEVGKGSFCAVGKDTFFNPIGFHYVFKLESDSAKRLDCCVWHGGNFRRFLFSYQETLYTLGGYGFFTTHNNLQYFNSQTKEWTFSPTHGTVPPFIDGLCFKINDHVYSINNIKGGNATSPNLKDTLAYKLNLKTMTWECFVQPDSSARIYGLSLYTNDYCFQFGAFQSLIFKPSEFKYLLIRNDDYGFNNVEYLKSINHNTILIKTNGGSSLIDTLFVTLNVDTIWKKNSANTKTLQLLPILKPTESLSYTAWLLAFVILGSIPMMAYYYKKRKKSIAIFDEIVDSETMQKLEIDDIPAEELKSDLYKAILNCGKLHVSTEELDELLAISHLEPDSKKLKRHRLLNKIEKNHPGFIVRVKDQIDKRQFSYKITRL